MLRVLDLTVIRGQLPVLDGVSFEVAPGEALILKGPNGVGKTSLLRTLAGLQPVGAGEVEIPEGAAYASHADGVKASLTVRENLAFWAEVYGTTLDEAIFEGFDLLDLTDRLAGTLSAGQKRRVGLARLGVMRAQVLLLDEPTVSLDGFSVKRFADFIQNEHLAKGGIAVIATHIDLKLNAPELDLSPFVAKPMADDTDEAFL